MINLNIVRAVFRASLIEALLSCLCLVVLLEQIWLDHVGVVFLLELVYYLMNSLTIR